METLGPLFMAWRAVGLRVSWQVIGHLTFARNEASSEKLPPGARYRRGCGSRPATLNRAAGAWPVLTDRIAMKTMGRKDGDALFWVRAFEPHADGQFHIHFVMASPPGAPPVTPDVVLERWVGRDPARPRFGAAKVEVFDPHTTWRGGRGDGYVLKGADDGVDIQHSPALARLRGDMRQ